MDKKIDNKISCAENLETNEYNECIALEAVYRAPELFGYEDFSEDTKSSFLLSIHAAMPGIIAHYDPARSKFFTYLVSTVRMRAKGYRRIAAKQKASDDSLAYCYNLEHHSVYELADPEPEYDEHNNDVEMRPFFYTKDIAETLIILAIKGAHTITEKQIELIGSFTKTDKQKLKLCIEQTKKDLLLKVERRQKEMESRNKAFFLKVRYRLELERMRPETPQYEIVEKQYKYQERLVDAKNELLKTKLIIAPSNTYIGKLLNIPPRRVSRIIEQAAKTIIGGNNRPNRADVVV
jgi:hypothetical protein